MTGWRPPLREPTAAPELTAEMTRDDLVFELKSLRFDHSYFRVIRVDEEVTNYLIGALTRQPTPRT